MLHDGGDYAIAVSVPTFTHLNLLSSGDKLHALHACENLFFLLKLYQIRIIAIAMQLNPSVDFFSSTTRQIVKRLHLKAEIRRI